MSEAWLPVVGYEGLYEVSDLGGVRSVTYIRKWRNSRRVGKVIRQAVNHRGYVMVRLCKNADQIAYPVHRLVLEAFVGPRNGKQACHGDGDKTHNTLSNLRWGTSAENNADKKLHGTTARGERHPRARLLDAQVCVIKQRLNAGEKPARLAREWGVSRSMVSHIKHGRRSVALGVAYQEQQAALGQDGRALPVGASALREAP